MCSEAISGDVDISQFGPPAAIRRALELARAEEAQTLADQIRLCEIAAPTFHEQRRAAVLAEDFRGAHLSDVHIDEAGNVHGRYGEGTRYIVVTAHMDTVFPEDTPLSVRREGPVLAAPGIGDDARGLATLLRIARILDHIGIATRSPILFVGTVAEEGYGNARGVRHLCDRELAGQMAAFLSIDGAGLAIANTAVGSYRHRVTIRGPGGHSYRAYGTANPNCAVGRAIAKAVAVPLPARPRTTFNIGRIDGGTGPNRLPDRACLEMEVRNSDSHVLGQVNDEILAAIRAGVDEERATATLAGTLDLAIDLLGHRPAGRTPEDSPIVRVARSATAAVGAQPALEAHSTDANYPISLGIPALALGVGAAQKDTHSVRETFDITGAWRGVARALLTVLGLAK
jgi:acetylornithine deacetylase/succinyl-diaminopimelate desuccinylase-like protein